MFHSYARRREQREADEWEDEASEKGEQNEWGTAQLKTRRSEKSR